MNLCVLEERQALYVGDGDMFYLFTSSSFLLSFFPSFLPRSPPFPVVIVSAHRVVVFPHLVLLCFCAFCLPFSTSAPRLAFMSIWAGTEETGTLVKTKGSMLHVCAHTHDSIICFFVIFVSEAIMYPTPLSTFEPHWLRSREITGEWSSAQ